MTTRNAFIVRAACRNPPSRAAIDSAASAFARTARVPCNQACVENGKAVAMMSCTRALATLTASAFARDACVPCIPCRSVSGLGCGHPCVLCVMTRVGHTTPANRGVTLNARGDAGYGQVDGE